MHSPKYFGTDGIRGPYGQGAMTLDFMKQLGGALALYLNETHKSPTAIIGRDTRLSGPELQAALTDSLTQNGVRVLHAGILPTPAIALAVLDQEASLGIAITASHNPAEDNGVKLFNAQALKLTVEEELKIESYLEASLPKCERVPSEDVAVLSTYKNFLKDQLPQNALAGKTIVLDTAHGATCQTSPAVLEALGATVLGIAAEADGARINARVGSEHAEMMAAAVVDKEAWLGLAHDGDGDRVIISDERGVLLDGDEVIGILALHAKKKGSLKNDTAIVTIHSNTGLDTTLTAAGIEVIRTAVGDRNVLHALIEKDGSLGGESSGHIIFKDIHPAGDGLLAALKLMEVMLETGEPLSALRTQITLFPKRTANITVREKKPIESLRALPKAMAELESELAGQGRILVRYSGTEPKLRLLVEGPENIIDAGIARLKKAAAAELC